MNLSGLDLNLLYLLHVVLEERSVARAAARLHVTSPAVSNALARLREALGDPLLVRQGRGLIPTPRALELAPRLTRVITELQRALEGNGHFDPSTNTRVFTIACSDADQICSIPRLAEAFSSALPRASLRVISIDQYEANGGLANSEIDAVISPAHELAPGVHAAELGEEEGVLMVRREHGCSRRRLTRAAFNKLRHVDICLVLGRAGLGNQAVTAFFAAHGLTREVACVVPNFTAAAMVAASTDLVAGAPRRLAERFISMLPLRILPSPLPPLRFRMQLLWHERSHHDAGSRFFRELVLAR